MGKKSRNEKKAQRRVDRDSARRAQASLGTRTGIDEEGRLSPTDDRRLYYMLNFLAEVCNERIEEHRRKNRGPMYKPLGWTFERGMNVNPIESRIVVVNGILTNIDWLVQQLETQLHDDTFRRHFRRAKTEQDIAEVRAWKMHVEDDFFIVDHIPYKGTVFVQLGRKRKLTNGSNSILCDVPEDDDDDEDLHEPRCFLVQGLSQPTSALSRNLVKHFERFHKAIKDKYSEFPGFCEVHTALLPWGRGITFSNSLQPPHEAHYRTPEDYSQAAKAAVDAYHKSGLVDGSPPDPSISVYTSLDPIRDAAIARLAIHHNRSSPVEQVMLSGNEVKRRAMQDRRDTTTMCVNQVYWTPYKSEHHPKYNQSLHQCAYGPRPFLLEGIDHKVRESFSFTDDEPCPFHRGIGREVEMFKQCCKQSFLKRVSKAEQTGNNAMGVVLYQPIEREEYPLHQAEAQKASMHPDPSKRVYDLIKHIRVAFTDMGMVSLTIPPEFVDTAKRRMDDEIQFQAVSPYKWEYLGCLPIVSFPTGIMVFGNLELNPKTGLFKGDAVTARGLYNIIREMKRACRDMPVRDAQLRMLPSHRVKPDPVALAQNEALLRENLDIEVVVTIDKQANASRRKQCGFCGMEDETKLCRCACKAEWYCCKEHQKEHWPDHKAICKEIQRAMKK